MLETRRLGRTGHMSTVVAFGGAALKQVPQEVADQAIQVALDHGVNHIDVAPTYGDAELRLGPWMPKIRSQVFLGCKTTEPTKEGAWASLRRSMERLQVDHFDLFQLHSKGKMADMEEALGPGGALEALVEAREQGLVDYLGITGHTHSAPSTFVEALNRFDFDTVMFPLNFVLWSIPEFRRNAQRLLDLCQDRDVGVQIIKTAASGPWGEEPRSRDTWYKPFEEQAWIDRAVAFVLSQPSVATLTTAGDVHIMPLVCSAAERYRALDADAQADLLAEAGQFSTPFVGRWA